MYINTNMDKINDLFLGLNQGNIFNQKQTNNNIKGLREGFDTATTTITARATTTDPSIVSDTDTQYQRKPVFVNAYNRMKTNQTVSTADFDELQALQNKYNDLSSQYKDVIKTTEAQSLEYDERISKENPYLNNNITLDNPNGELQLASSGVGGYVTARGMFKSYPDLDTLYATAGKNGCPALTKGIKNVTKDKYSSLLQNGTDMKQGQSCGAEGQNVYVSKMLDAPTAKYSGCFYNTDPSSSDSSPKAMTKVSDTELYTNDECKQYAVDSGYRFFAQQGVPDSNGKTTCLVGNDSTTIQQYGDASKQVNKTKLWSFRVNTSDGFKPTSVKLNNKGQLVFTDTNGVEKISNFSGNTNNPTQDYYLTLQKTGKLCLYNTTPNGKDKDGGSMWCSPTNPANLIPNPDWVSTKGKYGDAFLSSAAGQILFTDEWVGSTDGSIKLIMESDGSLVLYTSTISKGCITTKPPGTMKITNAYGINNNINAVFELNDVSIPGNLGNMAYIDNNSVAHSYSSNMIGYPKGTESKYNMYNNFDTSEDTSNISGGGPMNSINDCQTTCNSTDGCAGFVWVNAGEDANMCYLKNSGMFPKSPRVVKNNRIMAVRVPTINNVNMKNQGIQEIDTLRYQNYIKGDDVLPENADEMWKTAVISDSNKIQMEELQTKMVMLNQQIEAKIKEIYAKDQNIFDTMNVNDEVLKKKISSYKNTVGMGKKDKNQNMGQPLATNGNGNGIEGMQNIDLSDVNGMLEDTDIRVLQENYSYIFWSILAVGLLTITVDVMKRGNNK
jgi:hypothetical protein